MSMVQTAQVLQCDTSMKSQASYWLVLTNPNWDYFLFCF